MTEPMYRTPAGTQSETADEKTSCDRCGHQWTRNIMIQGRDPEQPQSTLNGRAPKLCVRCTIAVLSRTDPRARPGDGSMPQDGPRCEECERIMVRGKGKFCGTRCRVANWRKQRTGS